MSYNFFIVMNQVAT